MIKLWCLLEKHVFKLGFEKRGIFNKIPFLHKAFHGHFWKGMTSFLSRHIILDWQINLPQDKHVFASLINPTLAMSRTMGAFVL